MATERKISINKGVEVKSIEYPVIYTYIYERESQDIKRLADKFKYVRVKKTNEVAAARIIVGFKQDENGKIIPIYETPKAKAQPKAIASKKSATSKKTTVVSRIKRKADDQNTSEKSLNDQG